MKEYEGVDVCTHIFLTSALAVGEWSASNPGRFTPGGKAPGTHCIEGWVGSWTGLEDVEKRQFFTLLGIELRLLGRSARIQASLIKPRIKTLTIRRNFPCWISWLLYKAHVMLSIAPWDSLLKNTRSTGDPRVTSCSQNPIYRTHIILCFNVFKENKSVNLSRCCCHTEWGVQLSGSVDIDTMYRYVRMNIKNWWMLPNTGDECWHSLISLCKFNAIDCYTKLHGIPQDRKS
jgi:hypothetical protein